MTVTVLTYIYQRSNEREKGLLELQNLSLFPNQRKIREKSVYIQYNGRILSTPKTSPKIVRN